MRRIAGAAAVAAAVLVAAPRAQQMQAKLTDVDGIRVW